MTDKTKLREAIKNWRSVAKQLNTAGNLLNLNLEGASGHLFWETADNLMQLADRMERATVSDDYDFIMTGGK